MNLPRSLRQDFLLPSAMIRKVVAITLIVIALIIAAVSFGLPRLLKKDKRQGEEQQLTERLREWDEAYARRDGPALNRVLADEFVFIAPTGMVISRMQYLSANLKAPDIAVETPIHSEDVKVRVYGDAAVVTSQAAQRGQRFDRDPNVRFRYLDVWVNRGGRWQAVASQATRVTPH